jgi:hypothetical protein
MRDGLEEGTSGCGSGKGKDTEGCRGSKYI